MQQQPEFQSDLSKRMASLYRQQTASLVGDEASKFKRQFVANIENNFQDQQQAMNLLVGLSNEVGEDLTSFHSSQHFEPPSPIPADEARERLEAGAADAPFWRRAISGAVGAVEWWQENITEPTVATTMAAGLKAIPGEQDFEKRMRQLAAERTSQVAMETRGGILDFVGDATDAYRNTNAPWGVKGFLELVFDPLNLVGLGIPGLGANLARKAGMRALVRPLQAVNAIDNAPNVAVNKLLELPLKGINLPEVAMQVGDRSVSIKKIPGLKDIPGIKGLTERHWTSEVREARLRAHSAVAESFQQAGLPFVDGMPDHTRQLFSDMKNNPWDGGQDGLGAIMHRLTEDMSEDGYVRFYDHLMEQTPEEAAETLAGMVQNDVRSEIVSRIRPERKEKIESVLTKVTRDRDHAKSIAGAIEGFAHRFENVYLKKIEPLVVRPWALSHLAFSGFPLMQFVEDIGMATVGRGVNPHGVDDQMYKVMTAGLPAEFLPPAVIANAGKEQSQLWKEVMGLYSENPKPGLEEKLSLGMFEHMVKRPSRAASAIQRSTYVKELQRNFFTELREQGVSDDIIDNLVQFSKAELPTGLSKEVAENIQVQAARALMTGDPRQFEALQQVVNSGAMLQRAQFDVLAKFPELAPEMRRVVKNVVAEEGSVNRGNLSRVMDQAREKVFEYARWTPEGIRAQFKPFLRAIGQRPAANVSDALNQLRLVQHAGDDVLNVSREIMAFAKHRVRAAKPKDRDKIWEEAFQQADEIAADLKRDFEDALGRVNNPHVRGLIADVDPVKGDAVTTDIDTIFDNYHKLSELDRKVRQEVRLARTEHFAREDRSNLFFDEWDDKTDEIYGNARLERAEIDGEIRNHWNGLFSKLNFHERSPQEQKLMKSGLLSTLGDVDEELAVIVNRKKEFENAVPFSTPGQLPTIKARIVDLDKQIVKKEAERAGYERQLEEIGSPASRRKTPSRLNKYDKEIRVTKKALQRAVDNDFPNDIPVLEKQLADLTAERGRVFEDVIPDHMRPEWNRLKSEISGLESRANVYGAQTTIHKSLRRKADRLRAQQRRLQRSVETGEAHSEAAQLRDQVRSEKQTIAKSILRANDGKIPETIDRMEDVWRQAAETGAVPQPSPELQRDLMVESTRREIYAEIVDAAEPTALSVREQKLLNDINLGPDQDRSDTLVSLIERGMVTQPKRLRSGKWRVELTDAGREELERVPDNVDVQAAMANLPDYEKEFETVIDGHMAKLDDVFDQLIQTSDRPPMTVEQDRLTANYFDRMSKELDRQTTFRDAAPKARLAAARKAKDSWNKAYVNYDERSTFDYIMQRFMPFWMYESRRWPRLIRLAAKRPVLGKQFVMLGGEWDYGYQPTPYGMEFNPAKGTLAGGMRRALSRDFPELHTGYRGAVEEGMDWLGRFGFYFAPPITTSFNVLNGELAGNLPPALSSLLYAAGSFTDLPAGLEELAFDSKYTNFLVDTAVADKFKKNAQDVRRAAQAGDDDALSMLYLAKREAARKMFIMGQAGVLRYRPEGKREFVGSVEDAVEQFVGISKEDQADLKRLGVPLYSVIPTSGFQKRAVREAVGEDVYDTWVGNSMAFRPVHEQRELRRVDDFWTEHERAQLEFEQKTALLSDKWQRGDVSGPDALREYRKLQAQRSGVFEFLKSKPEFADVPVTMEERLEWAKQFGSPPPLPHPVDEVQERYYSISPDNYVDAATGETQWDKFFQARENVLEEFASSGPGGSTAVEVFRKSLQQSDTPFQRSLKLASPKIREYYGIRTKLLRQLEEQNPEAAQAYHAYRKLLVLETRALTPDEALRYKKQAVDLSARFPSIQMVDLMTRHQRQRMRQTDPEMATAYNLWVRRVQ